MKQSELKMRWANPEYLAGIEDKLTAVFSRKSLEGPVDLRGIIVGLDGAIERLEFASFEQANIKFVDLANSRFSCSFAQGEFREVTLTKCLFDTCNMTGARFSQCDVRASKITAITMDDATFQNCDFSETSFRGRGTNEYGGRRVVFASCNFHNARFKALACRACRFIDCQLDGVVFENCDLRGVKFEGGNVDSSRLLDCETNGSGKKMGQV